MSLFETMNQNSVIQISSPFIFNLCDDIERIREFYTGLLGFKEISYKEGHHIDYIIRNKTIMFSQAEKTSAQIPQILRKHRKGQFATFSLNLRISESEFPQLIEKISKSYIYSFNSFPEWYSEGLWKFVILDPTGNRITLYMEPAKVPASRKWCDLYH